MRKYPSVLLTLVSLTVALALVACSGTKKTGNLCSTSGDCPGGQACVSNTCVSITNSSDADVSSADLNDVEPDKTTGNEETSLPPFGDASEVETAQCGVDGDCVALLGTIGQCEAAKCDNGVCKKVAKGVNATCADGNGCTVGDHCDGAGKCVAGPDKPPCIEATNPCRSGATCVDDGSEKYHCDYAADNSKPCDDGKKCSVAQCDAGACVTTGFALWGSVCTTINKLAGICSEVGECLEPRRWVNESGQTQVTGFEKPGRFMQLVTTDDGKQWGVFLEVTPDVEGSKVQLRFHPVDDQGVPQAPVTPLAQWHAASPSAEDIQVVCFREYCVVTAGFFLWDKNAIPPAPSGYLRVLRYLNGGWERWQAFETALLLAMSNGAEKTYFSPVQLWQATMLNTATASRYIFGGQIWQPDKQGAIVECGTPCYLPTETLVIECTHQHQPNEVTCQFRPIMDNTHSDGQKDYPVQLMLTDLVPFDSPDDAKGDALAVMGMVADPWYSATQGFWRMTLRTNGEWSTSLLCDGLNQAATCGHDSPLLWHKWRTKQGSTGPDLKWRRRGLRDVHGVSPSELYKVGDPLKADLDAAKIATGNVFVAANMAHYKDGNWTAVTMTPGPATLAGETLPQLTVVRLRGVWHVNPFSVLVHGTRLTCEGNYSDCGNTVEITSRAFIAVYRPQTQSFERIIPQGDPYVCCDACLASMPKCTELNTDAIYTSPPVERLLHDIGARYFTINQGRDRLVFLAHDAYFTDDINNPARYQRKDQLLIYVKP